MVYDDLCRTHAAEELLMVEQFEFVLGGADLVGDGAIELESIGQA